MISCRNVTQCTVRYFSPPSQTFKGCFQFASLNIAENTELPKMYKYNYRESFKQQTFRPAVNSRIC